MGNHHVPVPAQVSAFLAAALALAAPAGAAVASGALPDVLIQAEERRPVSGEKPDLELQLKDEAALEEVLKTEEELRRKIPTEVAEAARFVPSLAESPFAAAPAGRSVVLAWKGEPARVFFPLEELSKVHKEAAKGRKGDAARWEWVVADGAGAVFRRYSGEGLPPERLEFDGHGDGGGWLRVGQAYTGVLHFTGADGRSRTAVARPFALAGLAVAGAQGGHVLTLASKALFGGERLRPKLTPEGKALLEEAAVAIQRYHAGLSLEVHAYLGAETAAAREAAAACAEALRGRLILAKGAVEASAHAGASDLEERVEIRVLNR